MAAPTRDELLERFPELAMHDPIVIDRCLALAISLCDAAAWGNLYAEAVGYLAAHHIDLRAREVGVMVGMPANGPSGTGNEATFYGQAYKALLRTLPMTGLAL